MSNELTTLTKEVSPITEKATAIEIKDQKTMSEAVTLLSTLNQSLDKITAEKEKVTKPLNEALKAERSRWKPIESILDDAITTIRAKMSEYQTEAARKTKAQEEKIAQRIGEGKGKLKMETAVKKLDDLARPDQAVATDEGMVKFRTVQTLKIVDKNLIPREYLLVDERAVLVALKANLSVPGTILEEKQVPVNFR